MDKPKLTDNRIMLAFAVAVIADMFEFPITWLEHFQWDSVVLIGKCAGVLLDCMVMMALTKLLGFHWLFLPSFCVEAIPTLDMFPTWVGCVAFILWQRKKQQEQPAPQAAQAPQGQPPTPPVIDVEEVKATTDRPAARPSMQPSLMLPAYAVAPEQTPPPAETGHEKRLKHLKELHDKDLISQTEYEAKRQQILAEI